MKLNLKSAKPEPPKVAPPIDPLAAAVAQGQEVLSLRGQITELLLGADAELRSKQAQLVEVREQLAIEEAEAALGAEDQGDSQTVRGVTGLVEATERIQARIAGLNKKMGLTSELLLDASDRLRIEFANEAQRLKDAYVKEHAEATEVYVRVLRKGRALADALGEKFDGIDAMRLNHPFFPHITVETVGEPTTITGGNTPIFFEASIRDEQWVSVNAALAPIRDLEKTLAEQSKGARYERFERHGRAGQGQRTIPTAFVDQKSEQLV